MRIATLLVLLPALAAPLPAADPPPTIDQLVEKLAANRKQQDEMRKAGEAIAADLRAALDALNKKLADLGIAPGPAPGPAPADPLAAAVQAAYAADPAAPATKAAQLADLAELYRQAAGMAVDHACLTAAELVDRVKAAAKVLKIDGLAQVRRLIAAEVAALFPEDVTLTADSRAAAKSLFLRVHAALAAAGR